MDEGVLFNLLSEDNIKEINFTEEASFKQKAFEGNIKLVKTVCLRDANT